MLQEGKKRLNWLVGALTAVMAALILSAAPQVRAEAFSDEKAIFVWTGGIGGEMDGYYWDFSSGTGEKGYSAGDAEYNIYAGSGPAGVSYSKSSNTLTLMNFNDPGASFCIRGMNSDFKIEVVGENHVQTILILGSGVEFTGSGTLVVGETGNLCMIEDPGEKWGYTWGISIEGSMTTLGAEIDTFNTSYADVSMTVDSEVTLQIYMEDPFSNGASGIRIQTKSAAPLVIKGTVITELISSDSYYEDCNYFTYAAAEGEIILIAPAGSDEAADTAAADTATSAILRDVSSLPTTAGAVGYAALDPSTQDALFANGLGVLSTAESNAYITSIGVEGWEVHFWAEGLPAATLGVVDAAGSQVTITNASLITVDGAAYLNFESAGSAAYALTSEEEAGLMQSVFGVAGIAVNGTPITTLW